MGWQEHVEAAWGVTVSGLRARGGHAEVHEGRQPALDRKVALKVIPASGSSVLVERFRREAQTIAKLSHPSIVPIHNFGVFGDVMVIMMPWYESSLADRSRAEPCAPDETRRIMDQMLDALRHAHAHGVVHRDVKPSNIMVGAEGRYVLTDFGIASVTDDATVTRTGVVPGTAGYLAPELISGGRPSPASDLYALGATLFEAVTGRPPFEADHAISAAYLAVHGPVPTPSIPSDPALAATITRLLSKDPAERTLPASVSPTRRRRNGLIVASLVVGAVMFGALLFLVGWSPTTPLAGAFVAPSAETICPTGSSELEMTIRWRPSPPAASKAVLRAGVDGTFDARVSRGAVLATLPPDLLGDGTTLTYLDADGVSHEVEVSVPDTPRWARFSESDDVPVAALQDGSTAPVLASPSEVAPGPLGNASVLVSLIEPGRVIYAAAAVDTQDGTTPGPVYVRVCAATPCGQESGDEAHVLDPVRKGWFASARSFGQASLLRFVWSSGTPGNDARLSEICALTLP